MYGNRGNIGRVPVSKRLKLCVRMLAKKNNGDLFPDSNKLHYITLHTVSSEKWQLLRSVYNSQIYEKDAEKRCVSRLNVNTGKVVDDVTSDGRLFGVFAAATGKARSAIYRAVCRVVGNLVELELRSNLSKRTVLLHLHLSTSLEASLTTYDSCHYFANSVCKICIWYENKIVVKLSHKNHEALLS